VTSSLVCTWGAGNENVLGILPQKSNMNHHFFNNYIEEKLGCSV
jgi:hypothetical protein